MSAEMGLSYEDFLGLSWQEYSFIRLGYERRIERQLDNTRHIMAAVLSPYRKKGAPPIRPKTLMPLPHLDKAKVFERVSDDRLKKLKEFAGLT